uniref:G protein-coupled receptor kinase n=1 Tax=Echeneis naucrates TaxID=173247 RepID=A0A665UE45_ECHNA
MDIGGLETVVANSAYVSTRGSVDRVAAAAMRDKKMCATVGTTFDSMCVKRPIGKRLFQQFLESNATQKNAGELWKNTEDYNVCQEKGRVQKAQKKSIIHFGGTGGAGGAIEKRILVKCSEYTFQTNRDLWLVMTITHGGDLRLHMYNVDEKNLRFNEKRSCFYTAHIICGLELLHQHRDLKPENILLDDAGHVRLSDLGLAVELPAGKDKTTGYAGTPVLLMNMVDYFTLGVTLYGMIAAKGPFRVRGEKFENEEVTHRILNNLVTYPPNFSNEYENICEGLMERERKRLRFTELKNQLFIKEINCSRLEAGMLPPPFVPDPKMVCTKDIDDVGAFSAIKGAVLDNKDTEFYNDFASGNVPIPWQEKMIETGVFGELSIWGEGGMLPDDLHPNYTETKGGGGQFVKTSTFPISI